MRNQPGPFWKLRKKIDSLDEMIVQNKQKNEVLLDHLYYQLTDYTNLEKEFYIWFSSNGFEIEDFLNITESVDEPLNTIYGYDRFDWDELPKQTRVNAMVEYARKDTAFPPETWKRKFKDEFGNVPYTELNRCKSAFSEQNPNEEFSTNGMAWYGQNS